MPGYCSSIRITILILIHIYVQLKTSYYFFNFLYIKGVIPIIIP